MDAQAGREAVDIALELLAKQGFDNTSMAQIAEATGIPADEVVGTLGSKAEIVLGVASDMLGRAVAALADVDPEIPLVDALMTAHSAVLDDIAAGAGPITTERMRSMSKAITSSKDLQKAVARQRIELFTGVLAERFDTSPSDARVQQGLKLWSAVLAATYLDVLDQHGRFDLGVDGEAPDYLRDRLNRAFRIVTGRSAGSS